MGRFDDIMNHKYIKSPTREHMSMTERAAQFGAFKAVVGHEDAIFEEARVTDEKTELDQYEKQEIGRRLGIIAENIGGDIQVSVTYFVADKRKSGGTYKTICGTATKVREFEQIIVVDGTEIPTPDIVAIESEIFDAEYIV